MKFAEMFKEKGKGLILCIDTFNGAGEMWFMDNLRDVMSIKAGQPRIYERWMINILANSKKITRNVLPWRVSSMIAADFLAYMPWKVSTGTHPRLQYHTPLKITCSIRTHWI